MSSRKFEETDDAMLDKTRSQTVSNVRASYNKVQSNVIKSKGSKFNVGPENSESTLKYQYLGPQSNQVKNDELRLDSDLAEDKQIMYSLSDSIVSSGTTHSTQPLNSFFADFINKIVFRKYEAVDKVLTEQPEEFYGVVDEMDKTILHVACEKNVLSIVKLILERLFDNDQPVAKFSQNSGLKCTLKYFLNRQNFDGLTALHFAAFRGNLDIVKYLTKMGANPFIKDKDGQNVVHIAAQGGKVNVIYYFLDNYKFDINDTDCRESTALHWASYLNKEITLSYLIAFGANINIQDVEGNTPLHLSVVSSDVVQETRCCKILLLKGASRNIINNNGQRPIDIVKDGVTKKELVSILKNPTY